MSDKAGAAGVRIVRPSSYEGWELWSCVLTPEGCKVRTYVDATGLWQTVAEISGKRETAIEILRMVELLNRQKRAPEEINSAFAVLRSLQEEGLNFATEMELEDVIGSLEKGGARTANI